MLQNIIFSTGVICTTSLKNAQKCIFHTFFCCCPNGQIMWIVECGMLISSLSVCVLGPLESQKLKIYAPAGFSHIEIQSP